jgi:hypothetical protein
MVRIGIKWYERMKHVARGEGQEIQGVRGKKRKA